MQEKLLEIKESRGFQFIVTVIILLSSIIVGVGTYEIVNETFVRILLALDTFITIFFIVEILIRFFAELSTKSSKMTENLFSVRNHSVTVE